MEGQPRMELSACGGVEAWLGSAVYGNHQAIKKHDINVCKLFIYTKCNMLDHKRISKLIHHAK